MVEKLDDLQNYPVWDRLDMLSQINGFVNNIKEAIGYKVAPLSDISNICLCGIGGSAMCGDILIDYLAPISDKHVTVVRSVSLPNWVNSQTLVVVISYSGNTKEALDVFQDALSRGLKVVSVSSGGELLKKAKENGIPFIQVPSGIQPRAALGYLLGSVAVILQAAGACAPAGALGEVIQFAQSTQERLAPGMTTSTNAAKKIALALDGKVPAVYCPRSIRSVGVRWQNQICENAKVVAFSGEIPEMNHNQMVGWLSGNGVNNLKPVFVVPSALEPTVKKMTMVSIQMFNERGLDPIVVQLEGKTLIENLVYGLILGDMISYYMALLSGVDPTPVDVIGEFKRRIST
ncbi:MAG TPA: bifunctional phosphoglucose/phosphomannose isomerase [Methanomassiliicoccales archaeon]|jgi:glucose/mannose-6-phosphate isomerase